MIYFQDLKDNLENDQVGSKAYSLSTMLNSGINVPKGFVINKFAYQNYKEQPDFLLKHKTTLASYLKKLKAKKLMVRSSAIGEDSKDASFAGQLESYQSENSLEAVSENILKCWSSLQSNRVKEYEQKQGRALVGMAVIIQEMIEPEYAGVLFTTSPITQEGKYLEYIEGHAEKLVQGEVTPESIEIDESTDTSKMPFNVCDLLSQSEKILKRYQDIPQDIEWAYKDKTFYFVQSRPITTLKDKIKWSNTNVNENYPDKLSPLLYSVAKQSYYHYYKNLALNLGVIKKDDPRAERYFANAIGIFGHRMYYNMSSIHNMIELTPIAKLLQKSFDDFVGYQKENKLNDKLSRGFENIKIAWKIVYHLLNLGQKVNTMEVAISDYAQKNKEQLSYNDLTKSFHTFLFIRFHLWVNASFADFYAMLTHGALGKFLEKVKVENPQGVQNGLIQGIPNLISNQPLLHLWQMNLLIKLKPHLRDLMKKTPEEILEQLQTNEDYSELKELVDLYLEEWGFRCPGELTFLSKNYIENPLSFIKMLKAYRDGKPENPQRLLDLKHAEQVNLAHETKIHIRRVFKLRPLKKYIYTFILSLLTKLTIFSIASRERVRLKQAQMYYTFKKTCLELGHYWLNKGLLNDANDIFYLEYTEINRILSGEEIDNEYIHNLILLRKKSIEKANQAPDNFYSFREDIGSKIFDQDINIESVDGQYIGLGACSGKVLGKVVVVENIDQIGKINKGDILVTKQTDPGWICVFPMISGLIVEKGGILSHSAIVAREFGIPAVVGLPKITKHLQDGQKVEVDGSLGVVRCLD